MDASVTPLRHSGLSLVQTTNVFYPLVEDPYMQGKIACSNVLSDLYAMGVTECDNMLMLIGISTKMTERECLSSCAASRTAPWRPAPP